jgi:N6-adenosine-specific RNA methylase IME4/ParB-like chromosome segregation protein Spo0J
MAENKDIKIDEEFHRLIPPLQSHELEGLEASIEKEGCRDALVVWNGVLLDGHNRYAICNRLGKSYAHRMVELPDRDAAKIWIIKNQFARRNLVPFQRAELVLQLEPLIAAKAKKNQRAGGNSKEMGRQISDNPIDTKKELASAAGVSHDTIAKSKFLSAKADEKTKERLRQGETTVNREYKAISRTERKAEQVRAIEGYEPPAGKFHVIVADPPWAYESRAADTTHRAANPYPSMTTEDICKMPVADNSLDDCILWLWTTNAFMVDAHVVAARWGFQVKTMLTWAKDRMGTGDWLRGQTEHCLMCIRGKPIVTLTNQTTLLTGPMREHSRKPDEFYALVQSLCPGSKCELFSREKRKGWHTFGAEAGKFR